MFLQLYAGLILWCLFVKIGDFSYIFSFRFFRILNRYNDYALIYIYVYFLQFMFVYCATLNDSQYFFIFCRRLTATEQNMYFD